MPSSDAAAAASHSRPIRWPVRRAHRTALMLGIAATAWAGCGDGGGGSGDTARGTVAAPAAAAAPAPRREFDVCAIAPQVDVDATLKQAGVNATVARAGGRGGQCSYRSEDGVASLLLEVTDYQTVERAQQSLGGQRRMAAERKYPIQDVTGIGDEGLISDEFETAGLKARAGAVMVRANLKLRNSSREQRHTAVEALGRMLVAQLP